MPLAPGSLFFGDEFNDATRALEGGLWNNPNPDTNPDSNQALNNVVRYGNDLADVSHGLTTVLGTLAPGGTPIDPNDQPQIQEITKILADIVDIQNNIAGATNDVNATAAQTVAADHLDILHIVNGDQVLANATMGTNFDMNVVSGFQNAPPSDGGVPAAQMPGNDFAQIGVIFDDAANMSLAGVNAQNKDAFVADLTVARDDMVNLLNTHPEEFQGLTQIHAEKIIQCLNLEINKIVPEYGNNPDAARETNDIFNDLTDVVTADTNLTTLANDGTVHGWTPAPPADKAPTPYQDNAAQTNFMADLVVSSQNLGNQAEALVQNGNHDQIANFEQILLGFENNVQKFDEAQGGIYDARFDNELEGNFGTIGAAIKGIIQGLNTHNADLVTAGVEQLNMNNADVGGNNLALGGVQYNTDGTTVAQVLNGSTPGPTGNTPLTPSLAMLQNQNQQGQQGSNQQGSNQQGPDLQHQLVPHGGNGSDQGNNAQGDNAQMGGENGAAMGAVNMQPIAHGDLVGLLQAMSETAGVAGNNTPMGGGNGAAPGAVDMHLVGLLQAMAGTADVAGNNAAVDMHHVPPGGNGIDHSIGVDHLHHALSDNVGLFHG